MSDKLRVIQTIPEGHRVRAEETWKAQSLGVALGGALVQEVPGLTWVASSGPSDSGEQ